MRASRRATVSVGANWGKATSGLRSAQVSQARVCLTLDKVRVVGLMGREHRCHLVVVRGVDVFVNAVPGQFYL